MSKHEHGKVCAILSYFLVGIIWYFVDEKMRKDSFAKFHAKQALFLLITSFVVSILLGVLSTILFIIPFIGAIFAGLLGTIVSLAILILWLFGVIYAATENKKVVPIIGSYAEKIFNF